MTPGQAAFELWVTLMPLPDIYVQWAQLPAVAQHGWEHIATVAVERARLNACPLCNGTCEHNICPHNNVAV